ncbi:MAG: hypothetical protein HYY93_16450, partial [Planctomycetes bacterium]|nr:hypothetical protein [Planctomycetota bacterium]
FKPQLVGGRRVTDEAALEVAKMVFAGEINTEVLSALDDSLHAVACTRTDLGFEKKMSTDPFRLDRVNRCLDRPLDVPDLAHQAARRCLDSGANPVDLCDAAASWLDADLPPLEARAGTVADLSATYREIFGEPLPETVAVRLTRQPLPPAVDGAVATLLRAVAAARTGLATAFSGLSPAERQELLAGVPAALLNDSQSPFVPSGTDPVPPERLAELVRRVDRPALHEAARRLVSEVRSIVVELQRAPAGSLTLDPTGLDSALDVPTPWGLLRLGGPGTTVHTSTPTAPEVLSLDLGGDDYYQGRIAGALGPAVPVSVAIDLSGSDRYESADPLSQGAGLFGLGVLWDAGGTDTFRASHFSQGCGCLGAGLWFDGGGDDVATADTCAQGAAAYGVGLAVDMGGNDTRRAALYAQGFGFTWGFGALVDWEGNDLNYAGGKYSHEPLLPDQYQSLSQGFGLGQRYEGASGGIGLLYDRTGNDVYSAEVYGQGASYWYALGLLIDDTGNDAYTLTQYGQGAGIHLSVGGLLDRSGKDSYTCHYGVAQGCGHDFAVGVLVEGGGDDYYQGSGLTQGASNANGVGILVDVAGNDGYSGVADGIQGYGAAVRDTVSLGILLDLGGGDKYSAGGHDDAIWTRSTIGVGLDRDSAPKK